MMLSLLDAVPALFAGSAVLLKPSEVTPRFTAPLMETVRRVPELAEVFDVVLGDGSTGQEVIANVDLVCFTGSVATGRKVALACAERLIPCFLEMGGKDPVIVTQTADIDRATTAVLRGGVYATGQVCYSIERIYVHESIHDAFVAALVEKAQPRDAERRESARGTHRSVHLRAPARDRRSASEGCRGEGRDGADRRRHRDARRRALHAPHRAHRRDARHADHARRDLRADAAGDALSHRR